MGKTLYEIDYIIIDLERLIDNSASVEIDIALFRDDILYRSPTQFIIEIPYIKGTDYFFSSDFDNYTYNQCTVETLLMMGLVKRLSDRTKELIDRAIKVNKLTKYLDGDDT